MPLRAISASIRHKLAFIVLATTLAALLVTGIALVIYDLRAYRTEGFTDLSAQAEILGRASVAALAFDDPKVANEYLQLLRQSRRSLRPPSITPRENCSAATAVATST